MRDHYYPYPSSACASKEVILVAQLCSSTILYPSPDLTLKPPQLHVGSAVAIIGRAIDSTKGDKIPNPKVAEVPPPKTAR